MKTKRMVNRRGGLWSLALVLVAAPLAAECIPEGETVDVPFDRPEPPPGDDPDKPPFFGPRGGDPQAEEVDGIRNDPMGKGDPIDGKATVPITNDGGDLKDRNGETQNGLGEGPCLEVQVCWTAYVYETRLKLVLIRLDISETLTGGGFDLEWKAISKYWEEEICSDVKEVCPEGDC